MEPVILPRECHALSRKDVSHEALKVLYRLRDMNFKGYLAGGCVRDLMLGRKPKDFDVATDATPTDVKRIFRNCRLIGRRFRLAHVYFQSHIIEVATFRSNMPEEDDIQKGHVHKKDGLVLRDNRYGSPGEDAVRRDFTINALFYDIDTFSIIDYAGGLKDLEDRLVRCIGEPDVRYREDPVRMIRAVRFAASLDLKIEKRAWKGIIENADQLAAAAPARLFEEVLKFFHCGAMAKVLPMLEETGLLKVLFPDWAAWLETEASEADRAWVDRAVNLMDECRAHGIVEQPSMLFALLFGSYHEARSKSAESDGDWGEIVEEVIRAHHRHLAESVYIPQREILRMVRITGAQARFRQTEIKQANRFHAREYFNDALAYFKFSCKLNEAYKDRLAWWNEFLKTNERKPKKPGRKRKRRTGKSAKSRSGPKAPEQETPST